MKRLLLAGLLVAFIFEMSQAQVLKKSPKKNTPTSEQIVSNTPIDVQNEIPLKSNEVSNNQDITITEISKVPDNYNFDWQYHIKIESKDGENVINYLIKKDAPYYGMKVSPKENLYMVIDKNLELMIMFSESEGKKMINAASYKNSLQQLGATKNFERDKYKFKKVGNKNILGYNCKGFQVENQEEVMTFYITTEPGIQFDAIYNSDQTNLPKNFNPDWIYKEKAILMQLSMEGLKNAKNNITLTCTKLSRKQFNLNKKDYISITDD